jgi:hypothetical protein
MVDVSQIRDLSAPMTQSASRIQSWMNCNRRAAWHYFCGLEEGGNLDTEVGGDVHAYLEGLFDSGRWGVLPDLTFTKDYFDPNKGSWMTFEIGKIAASALPHVRHFSAENLAVAEGQFLLKGDRHVWQGFKDLSMPGHTQDYKTTGDFKWTKTADDLLVDPQAILYAEHAFRRDEQRGLSAATHQLQWTYLKKKAPYGARKSEATVTREHAARGFAALEDYADEMQRHAYACAPLNAEERERYVLRVIQPNFDHCTAYRGCPHRSRCPDSPMFYTQKGPATVSLLNKLNGTVPTTPRPSAPAAPSAPATPPAPPATAAVAPATAPGFVDVAAIFAIQAPANPTPGGNPYNAAARTDIPGNDSPAEVLSAGINPPARRGPGRPPGSKNKPKDVAAPAAAPAAPVAAPVVPDLPAPPVPPTVAQASAELAASLAQADAPPAPIPAHELNFLLVGCTVRGLNTIDAVDFDILAAAARDMIGAERYFRDFGYKTNGLFLEALQRIIGVTQPPSVVIADPRTPEATLASSYLRGIARTIVEGRV